MTHAKEVKDEEEPSADAGSDEDDIDIELILQQARAEKIPPRFLPRSRSPSSLPGGIRVRVLQRPEPRMKPRLEAASAGLREMAELRDQQAQLITAVINRKSGDQPYRPFSVPENGFSNLTTITENGTKCTSGILRDLNLNIVDGSPPLDQTLSVSDGDAGHEQELGSGTQCQDSLPVSSEGLFDVRKPRQTRSFSVPHISYLNRLALGQDQNSPPPDDLFKSGVRPTQTRRASIQCEAVLTNRTDKADVSKLLSEVHASAFGSNSLKAFARKCASASNLSSLSRFQDKIGHGDDDGNKVQNILKQWNSSSNLNKEALQNQNLGRISLDTGKDLNLRMTFPRRHSLPVNHLVR